MKTIIKLKNQLKQKKNTNVDMEIVAKFTPKKVI